MALFVVNWERLVVICDGNRVVLRSLETQLSHRRWTF